MSFLVKVPFEISLTKAMRRVYHGTATRYGKASAYGLQRHILYSLPSLPQKLKWTNNMEESRISDHRQFHTSAKSTSAKDWNASQYLKFEEERTRPSRDLLSAVPLYSPKTIIDIGCGPGNSTAVLLAKFPHAHISGMDSSPNMIQKAKATLPGLEFTLADLNTYTPDQPVDLLFSNAVFQWLSKADRIGVIQRLIQSQSSGGVLAFQVPDNFTEPSHVLMRAVAAEGPWSTLLNELKPAREQFQTPEELYNQIKPLCSSVNLWQTHYQHVLDDHRAIVEWVSGTGLRPFIDPLPVDQRDGFIEAYLWRLKEAYPTLYDGKVLLRYPRLFMVAVRG
jgi:trans-aconitate 2-methyltransferase